MGPHSESMLQAERHDPRWDAREVGPRVSFRAVDAADVAGLSAFYAQLSPEARRRRFLCGGDLAPDMVGRLAHEPGIVGSLVDRGPRDGEIVAHASVQPDGPGAVEVAFAVADELQGRGLGRRLVRLALDLARHEGASRASATLLPDNVPMRRLLRGAGCPIVADSLDAGVEEITLALGTA